MSQSTQSGLRLFLSFLILFWFAPQMLAAGFVSYVARVIPFLGSPSLFNLLVTYFMTIPLRRWLFFFSPCLALLQ